MSGAGGALYAIRSELFVAPPAATDPRRYGDPDGRRPCRDGARGVAPGADKLSLDHAFHETGEPWSTRILASSGRTVGRALAPRQTNSHRDFARAGFFHRARARRASTHPGLW